MKKAQVIENSTASSALAPDQLGISYAADSLSEQSIEENDDECHIKVGRIQQVQDFLMLPTNQQVDIFIRMLNKDQEGSLWNQSSRLHFQEKQYFQHDHQFDSIQMNPASEPDQEQGHSCNEVISQKGQKLESISSQNIDKARRHAQPKNLQKKFKKNVNVPKAIGRYLMDYHHLFEKSIFLHQQHYFQDLSRQLKDLKTWVRKSKKNSFKLTHLNHFFSADQDKRHSALNRLMMRKILHKCLRNEIIPNNQVKDKLEYLVASKVFSLRCTNSKLSTRMQMH